MRSSWSNIRKVASWEIGKNIKSPIFLVFTIMVPAIMLAGGLIGYLTGSSAAKQQLAVAVIDETAVIYPLLEEQLAASPVKLALFPAEQQERLAAEVKDGTYNGCLHITAAALENNRIDYYVKDVKEQNVAAFVEGLREAVTVYRLQSMGLTEEQVRTAMSPVAVHISALTGDTASPAAMLVPMAVGMVLIFSAMFTGQVLMFGVIKEKRNRIVEIILSSISSLELLLGKLVGFAVLGLLQIALWLAVGLSVAGCFFDLRQLSLTFGDLLPSLLFFLGGYLLFASLFATLGATMKDAEGGSQLQGLVVLVPIVPIFASGAILMSPNALWVRVFSFLPPFIPVTMLFRLAATTLPWWELGASFIMLIVSVFLFIHLGARIFDRSILQYERTFSFRDIGRMLKKGYS